MREVAKMKNSFDRYCAFCVQLSYYLTCRCSLKDTCEALFTHRNTVLYRIRKMREDFAVPPDSKKARSLL